MRIINLNRNLVQIILLLTIKSNLTSIRINQAQLNSRKANKLFQLKCNLNTQNAHLTLSLYWIKLRLVNSQQFHENS